MPQALEEDVEAWKNRLEKAEQKRKNKLDKTMAAATRCSQLLQDDFNVNEVYLVGSSQDQERFHKKSDLDLAVKGLSPVTYYQALTRCWDQVPAGTRVDLITLEDLSRTEKKSLLENGRELSRVQTI